MPFDGTSINTLDQLVRLKRSFEAGGPDGWAKGAWQVNGRRCVIGHLLLANGYQPTPDQSRPDPVDYDGPLDAAVERLAQAAPLENLNLVDALHKVTYYNDSASYQDVAALIDRAIDIEKCRC